MPLLEVEGLVKRFVRRRPFRPTVVVHAVNDVSFTVAEAEAVVELSNTADPNTLDDKIGLDSRAAHSIVDARPVSTVQEISGLYYVGASALTKL